MTKEESQPDVRLSLVLGYIAVKDLATVEKKVAVLDQLGYTNQDMAKICSATAGVIATLKSRIKKGN
jgi:hypothetical protein